MFKTFPEFSKLTLADREEYERYIKDFPPVADISFGSLMTWWNQLHSVKVSKLHGNLVIQYWLPEDDGQSGLCLVGTSRVDESICEIFDYLGSHNFPIRLVNVPHFVIEHVAYPSMFNFTDQRDMHEYILSIEKFFPIENLGHYRRSKVKRQLKQLDNLEVRPIDLHIEDSQKMVLDMVDKSWDLNLNNFGKMEQNALNTGILRSKEIGMESIGLFQDGKLQGICLYERPSDKAFIIVSHIKAVTKSLVGYELMAHLFAEWFIGQGIKYANINTDAGIIRLRMFMLALGPSSFFHKYTVEPS